MSRSVLLIGLIGGSLFLLAGIFSILIWAIAGPIAGVLLGSWFGGEIKKRLDRAGEERMETRVIRFRQKAVLEENVSDLRSDGWVPKWESYRETQTGLLRRTTYSVVMERKHKKLDLRGPSQLGQLLAWTHLKRRTKESDKKNSNQTVLGEATRAERKRSHERLFVA